MTSSASAARAANDAGRVDEPRDERRQRPVSRLPVASSAFTACARTVGSGSAAAPISALTCAAGKVTGCHAVRPAWSPSRATGNEVWLCSSALAAASRAERELLHEFNRAGADQDALRSIDSEARQRRQHRGVTRACAIHRVGQLRAAAFRRSPSPHHSIHLPRRPLGRTIVVTRRAGVRHAEGGGHLRHRRLKRVIAPADQQPPVHVAHVAADAATARRRRLVKGVRSDRSLVTARRARGPAASATDALQRTCRTAAPANRCTRRTCRLTHLAHGTACRAGRRCVPA